MIGSGYNGTFPFEKPGDPYDDHNYIGMRIVCTAMGAALVPLRSVFPSLIFTLVTFNVVCNIYLKNPVFSFICVIYFQLSNGMGDDAICNGIFYCWSINAF